MNTFMTIAGKSIEDSIEISSDGVKTSIYMSAEFDDTIVEHVKNKSILERHYLAEGADWPLDDKGEFYIGPELQRWVERTVLQTNIFGVVSEKTDSYLCIMNRRALVSDGFIYHTIDIVIPKSKTFLQKIARFFVSEIKSDGSGSHANKWTYPTATICV